MFVNAFVTFSQRCDIQSAQVLNRMEANDAETWKNELEKADKNERVAESRPPFPIFEPPPES